MANRANTNNSTPENAMEASRRNMEASKRARKDLMETYTAQKKISTYLSPMYRPYFGNNMQVSINGITICFPVDGSTHDIPEAFASEIARRRMCIDNMLSKQERMSAIPDNAEGVPGALTLF